MSILRKPHGFGLLVQFNRNCPTGSTVVVPVVVKAVAVVVVAVAAVAVVAVVVLLGKIVQSYNVPTSLICYIFSESINSSMHEE